jgi:hypothetical protein
VPTLYKTPEGYLLGKWQSHQRRLYKERKLFSDRIRRLEEIGFTWERLEEMFEKGFQETLLYKKKTGDLHAPNRYRTAEGFQLGAWQNTQKVRYKIRKLSPDRVKRLEEIGFIWELLEEKFEKGFLEALRYKESMGNPNVPHGYKTPEGYRLDTWQSHQRGKHKKGKLSQERVKRLEDIGFKWEIQEQQREEQFEKGFQETLLYKESTGNPNTPFHYNTPEGYRLGRWQNRQRSFHKKGRLSQERIKRLNEIGFIWKIIRVEPNRLGWDRWYELTMEYKNEFGNPNAPQNYKTADGFWLGTWQNNQMVSYKRGKLSPGRIKRLEDIGFKWGRLEEQFEKGFQETLIYKNSTGYPNAPASYKTEEGFLLGSWLSDQRSKYKKGKLSQERVKRLEDIGFKWRMKK